MDSAATAWRLDMFNLVQTYAGSERNSQEQCKIFTQQ